MTKQKCPHEKDYTTIEHIWENEEHFTELVECIECGAKGEREFVFVSENWFDN